ncbi:MAG: hypothetical protein ACP5N3_05915 [Candidatus Nanoarchaeia archaeon]
MEKYEKIELRNLILQITIPALLFYGVIGGTIFYTKNHTKKKQKIYYAKVDDIGYVKKIPTSSGNTYFIYPDSINLTSDSIKDYIIDNGPDGTPDQWNIFYDSRTDYTRKDEQIRLTEIIKEFEQK